MESGCFKKEEINTPCWIGPYEIKEYLSKYYNIESIVRDELTQMPESLYNIINAVKDYFTETKPLLLICSNGKKTYSIGGVRTNTNTQETEILILDPHFCENVKKSDYINYYTNRNIKESSHDTEEVSERKNTMIKESLRWESATLFFTSELYWSVLFPKLE